MTISASFHRNWFIPEVIATKYGTAILLPFLAIFIFPIGPATFEPALLLGLAKIGREVMGQNNAEPQYPLGNEVDPLDTMAEQVAYGLKYGPTERMNNFFERRK